jgi:hypothetical protein
MAIPKRRPNNRNRVATMTFLCTSAAVVFPLSIGLVILSCQNTRDLLQMEIKYRDSRIDYLSSVQEYLRDDDISSEDEKVVVPDKSHVALVPGTVGANGTEDEVKTLRRSASPPESPSPYEIRYPGYKRPEWASKPFFFQLTVPDDMRLCFVHVGKTAGSTIGCHLGFQLHCGGKMKYPLGLLPKYTTHTFHNGVNDCPDDTAYYLFVVRNPLERLRSAYAYDRPGTTHGQRLLYQDCPFFYLNDLVEQGLATRGNASAVCRQRAYNAVRGLERFGRHLYFNYHYYTNETLTDDIGSSRRRKQVVVVRNEHLQEDWVSIEAILGGNTGSGPVFPTHNKGQNKEPGDIYLPDESRLLLCHALCEDIQVYKSLLRRAANLTPEQVATSLQELSMSCPTEAVAKSCPKAKL